MRIKVLRIRVGINFINFQLITFDVQVKMMFGRKRSSFENSKLRITTKDGD